MKKKISLILLSLVMLLIQSSYVDAASKTSLSVGTDYQGWIEAILSGINDTTDEAQISKSELEKMGYDATLITKPTFSSLAQGYRSNGRHVLESNVLFLAGHANSTMISWNYKGKGGEYAQALANNDRMYTENSFTYTGLGSKNMNYVDLAIFLGCKTAELSNSWNLAWYAYHMGANTTVGWTDDVPQTDTNAWTSRFFQKLSEGSSVNSAVQYANSFNYVSSKMKSTKIYGNSNATVKSVSTNLTINQNSENKLKEFNVNESILLKTKIEGLNKINVVGNIIKSKVNSKFDIKDYIIETVENSDGVIYDFYYAVDGIKTNVGYTIFMNNEETLVKKIVDNFTNVELVNKPSKLNILSSIDFNTQEIKQTALEKYSNDSYELEIVDEYKYYDIINDKLYYIVDIKQTDKLFNTSAILSYIEEL